MKRRSAPWTEAARESRRDPACSVRRLGLVRRRLAATERRGSIVGFQFHPEGGGPGFERWLIGHANELAGAGIDVAALRRDGQRFEAELARKGGSILERYLAAIF